VRTGHVLPANYDGLQFRPGPRCVEMGFIDRRRVPEVMRLADVVIQPGDADGFNSYRLPAKVPEYLSMGKALVVGGANIGEELMRHRAALVLERMSPAAMAAAVERLLDGAEDAAALGTRAREFAQRTFHHGAVIPKLEAFYESCLHGR
jgi:glycosyltransferase involved in cell wall biosynthesis